LAARLTVVGAGQGYVCHVLLLWRDTATGEYWAWELYDHSCSDERCCYEYDHMASGVSKAEVCENVPTHLWALLDAAAAPPKKELWMECVRARQRKSLTEPRRRAQREPP
jgi:hypothetical protein